MARELAQRTQSAVAEQNDGPPTLAQLIERMKPEIARALPQHVGVERITRMAATVLNLTPKLKECTATSFLGALMSAAQLGLEPGTGTIAEAYLIPYGNTVTFIPSYVGLMKLAYNSGMISSISAHVVYEHDDFQFEYGRNEDLKFAPALGGDRGKPLAVYADAHLKDGSYKFVVLSISAVEAIRGRSRAGQKGPWVTDWPAMARKTAVRQLIRWLPLSAENRNLVLANRLDESVRTDVSGIDEAPVGYITGDLVETEQGLTDPESGEVVEPTVVEDPPDVPDGW